MIGMIDLLNKLLSTDTENEVLEFKKAQNQIDKDKLGRYFTALSNEANLKNERSAYIILGVDNSKCILGTKISDKQLNEYKLEIANHTSPSLNFIRVERIPTEKGSVILLEIPAAPQGMPIAWKTIHYARNGESLSGMSIEKIERIRSQVQTDWSKQIITDATINDLDEQAILKARVQYAEKNNNLKEELEKWDDITFLNKAKLTINGKITRASILLLGKSESDHYLDRATSKITWILRDRDGIEKDYKHFFCPLLLEVENVFAKIRNLKYRYMKEGTLFPDEVDQFDPYIIREALNNCIAHQDYTLGGKINVVEREDGLLSFSNAGSFIPQSIEKVITADAPEELYRNPFLANAMVNLNMIDTIGSGIKKMFVIQKNKYFPLPEYDISDLKVVVTITGKVIDINYARKLAQMPDLRLQEIMLLDKVQKRKELTDYEIQDLRYKKLIEGRKPNFHISERVAFGTGQESDYFKQKGVDDEFCRKIIVDYLSKFQEGKRSDFEDILLNKLSDQLEIEQKRNRIKNILQSLKKEGLIIAVGKKWKMSKHE